MTTRRFRSFAKVNLGLEVTGKLPGGYHELKTLFATISLHDVIEIAETKGPISVRSDHPEVPADETNLAYRAAASMRRIAGRKGGVSITIQKRIPVGGGLGGGSSNAATVLRALDRIWNAGLSSAELIETAKSLGADVPYFLVGGPALGLGRGDDIQALDLRLEQKVLVVPGPGGVSTAGVFRRFDEAGRPSGARSRLDSFLRSGGKAGARSAVSIGALRNDLEGVALEENPLLAVIAAQIRRVGHSAGAVQAAMSGSGSSFFLLFDETAAMALAAKTLREAGLASLPCSFLSRRSYQRRFEVRDAD